MRTTSLGVGRSGEKVPELLPPDLIGGTAPVMAQNQSGDDATDVFERFRSHTGITDITAHTRASTAMPKKD